MRTNYYDLSEDLYAGRPLNWDNDLYWDTEDYPDQAILRCSILYIYPLNYGITVR